MSAFRVRKTLIQCCWFIGCLLTVESFQAQSLDARFPTPVRTNEVVGRIGARDIGDARLTDHFYALTGTHGDLLVTIETRNLNGDVDIFTAGALRPVLKVALYAEVNAPVTKSIYLRNREDLILRVEARTPNDDDGVYHIRFSGSFEPIAAAGNEEGSELATSAPVIRKGKRVSSVGARIDEPVPPPLEVAETATPEPSPVAGVDPPPVEPRPAEPPVVETKVVETPSSSTARTVRTRPSSRRSRSRPDPKTETPVKPVTEESPKEAEALSTEGENKREPEREVAEKPVTPAKKSSKRSKTITTEQPAERSESSSNESTPAKGESTSGGTRRRAEPAPTATEEATAAPPEDLSKSKLIIEMLDGTRIERFMTTIRRVDVRNGQIVVTASDGTVERIRLARVLRMTIGR